MRTFGAMTHRHGSSGIFRTSRLAAERAPRREERTTLPPAVRPAMRPEDQPASLEANVVQPAKSCTTTRQNIEIVSFFNRFNNTWKLKAPTQCADTLRRKGLLHVHAIPEISAQPANADGGSLAMLAKESIRWSVHIIWLPSKF